MRVYEDIVLEMVVSPRLVEGSVYLGEVVL